MTYSFGISCNEDNTEKLKVLRTPHFFSTKQSYRETEGATNPSFLLLFFHKIKFCYCPDYFCEKDFGHRFFLQMLYRFKARKLVAFLAHGRQYRRMSQGFFVTSSQGFIRQRNKHNQIETANSILFFSFFSLTPGDGR